MNNPLPGASKQKLHEWQDMSGLGQGTRRMCKACGAKEGTYEAQAGCGGKQSWQPAKGVMSDYEPI